MRDPGSIAPGFEEGNSPRRATGRTPAYNAVAVARFTGAGPNFSIPMSALPFAPSDPRSSIAALLTEARDRTLLLVEGLSDEDLHRQHSPLMSPVLWDLGHIAHFEELWLTQNLDGPIEFSEMPGIYNPFEHPRAERAKLPLPALESMRAKLAEIREKVMDRLARVDLDDPNPLLSGGYVYHMVLQHEYQHNETILQTLQLKLGEPISSRRCGGRYRRSSSIRADCRT